MGWTMQDFKIPCLFPDLSNFPNHFTEFPDFSLTLKKKQISMTFPWPVGTLKGNDE